jgi:hypothetical protein
MQAYPLNGDLAKRSAFEVARFENDVHRALLFS